MKTLAEIRAKLASKANNQQKATQTWDNASYPFWNIPDGSTATLRFLPDGDASNTFFWVERLMIKLPFAGIKNQSTDNVTVDVPCMEMYGKNCPILTETRPWWKDPDLMDEARKYWKKKSYIFQGFVISSPLIEENVPENPIRRFVINSSIFKLIEAVLMDPDLENNPTDYEKGLEFRLTKTKQGQYADYSTSSWRKKESALTDEQLQAIATHGLYDLKTFLPKEPDAETVNIIEQMFKDSVDGNAYDPDKYGQYYKPSNFKSDDGEKTTPTPAPTPSKPVAKAESLAALKTSVKSVDPDEDAPASGTKPLTAKEIMDKLKLKKTA